MSFTGNDSTWSTNDFLEKKFLRYFKINIRIKKHRTTSMHPQYDHVAWHEIAPGLESSLKNEDRRQEDRQGLIQSLITIYYRSIVELEKICGLMPLRL